jgi:hypothetical protein
MVLDSVVGPALIRQVMRRREVDLGLLVPRHGRVVECPPSETAEALVSSKALIPAPRDGVCPPAFSTTPWALTVAQSGCSFSSTARRTVLETRGEYHTWP